MADRNQRQSQINAVAFKDDRSQQLLGEVDLLLDDIIDSRIKNRFRIYDRFEVFVSHEYTRALEDKIDELIFGPPTKSLSLGPGDFIPSPKEAMYLDAACRLRTIGLLWGIFCTEERHKASDGIEASFDNTLPNEPNWCDGGTVDPQKLEELIETFPSRTSRFLQRYWNLNCSWNEAEKATLSSILNSYLPNVDEEDIPEKIGEIRVRKLAYILRLGTVCTIGPGVCPLEIRLKLKPRVCCDSRKTHLAPVEWIGESFFDHGRNTFELSANIPCEQRIPDPRDGTNGLPIACIDFAPAMQFLGAEIQQVVNTTYGYLSGCTNTSIRTVVVSPNVMPPGIMEEAEAYLPSHWALPLAAASNAAEVVGTAALILRSFCNCGSFVQTDWAVQVAQVCEGVEEMHPCNAIVRKFVADVRKLPIWGATENFEKQRAILAKFVNDSLLHRADAGDRVASEAAAQNVLKDKNTGKDVAFAVVRGYSRAVLSTLLHTKYSGLVNLVKTPSSAPWMAEENTRIKQVLDQAHIQFQEVRVELLSALLSKQAAAGEGHVFLMGARAAWCSNGSADADRFLCPAGVQSIASAVKRVGGQRVMLSEKDKLLDDQEMLGAIRRKQVDLLEFLDEQPWMQVDEISLNEDVDQSVMV